MRRVRAAPPHAPMLDLGDGDHRGSTAAAEPAADRRVGRATAPAIDAAGYGARLAAGVLDLAVLVSVDVLVVSLTLQICGLTAEQIGVLPPGPLLAFLALQNGGYLVAFTTGGQTLGKMAVGIRVISAGAGTYVDPGRAALRTLIWALMALPAGLGFASVLLDPERRGWHDHFAGTRVVRSSSA